MLKYMLDTTICIHVMKTYPPELREKLNVLADSSAFRASRSASYTMAQRNPPVASRT
jgi:hypothetical protein